MVVVEVGAGVASANSIELIAAATDLANRDSKIIVVCLGSGISQKFGRDLSMQGADQVVVVDDQIFEQYVSDAWVLELTTLAREFKPSTVLFPHSTFGTDAAPRLAFRLETAVVTGCVAAEKVDDRIYWTRSCYGGSAREVVSLLTEPSIATIKERAFDPLPPKQSTKIEIELRMTSVICSDVRTRVTEKNENNHSGIKLDTADIVVSGGRGLGGPTQFKLLEELANLLGGAAGASRVACDLSWCPASWQVGLSGKTVAPKLYMALGISGAAQHLSGCGNSGAIVAINTDPEAEIFKSARFGVVADCTEFLPAFIKEIRKIQAKI
jgi:electron transfer flavoprotein alpha subunit